MPPPPHPTHRSIRSALLALVFSLIAAHAVAQVGTSDDTLAGRLDRILSSVPAFAAVEVSVTEGVVTLEGELQPGATRADLVALIERVEGVLYVVDNSLVSTDLERSISPAVAKLREYANAAVAFAPLLGIALVVVAVFWLLAALVGRWEAPFRRLGINPMLRLFARQSARAAVFLLGLLLALDVLGATPFVAAVLGTAGVAGLAVGFAFRDIIENYLAGLLMGARQPFDRGDIVRIGDQEGKVLRLTARELVLMTFDGNHVRIPNATVFKREMTNFSRNPRRRFSVLIGVGVGEDLVHVQELGLAALRGMPSVLDEPAPFSLIRRLAESTVEVQFFGWVDQRRDDFAASASRAIRVLKGALDRAGVEMPEPITRVHLRPQRDADTADAPATKGRDRPEEQAPQLAPEADVADQLDAQIAEDVALSDEEDLLSDGGERAAR